MTAERPTKETRDEVQTRRPEMSLVWKDTGKKCHSGNDREHQTCPTDAVGGADGTGPVRYDGLEDGVKDPRHEEEKGSDIMSPAHRCFLEGGSGKRHFITLVFITGPKCAARGGQMYLEGCDNNHPKTGSEPK